MDGGAISTSTSTNGSAGSVSIRANDLTLMGQVGDDATTGFQVSSIGAGVLDGTGVGGLLSIESDRLSVLDGAQIAASTFGSGDAGNVEIVSDSILIEGSTVGGTLNSAISSRSTTSANAGSARLTGDRITLNNEGTVSVSNSATGGAGNVSLMARTLSLNIGTIEAEASAGDQGNINIESRDFLLLRRGSRITTNATETATGGNISINAPIIVGTENSDISANAVEGDGGNIRLITQDLIGLEFRDRLTPENNITASSELGVDGAVNIESPNVDPDSGLIQLPENLSDAHSEVVASCGVQTGNQFVSSGRGGLPENPLQPLNSDNL